jgi:hypothetical protein
MVDFVPSLFPNVNRQGLGSVCSGYFTRVARPGRGADLEPVENSQVCRPREIREFQPSNPVRL